MEYYFLVGPVIQNMHYLGALRSAAQMISYEISLGFIVLTVCICSGSFNLNKIIKAQQKFGI
jgi:NADH-quinone oxidoreductase subunit H